MLSVYSLRTDIIRLPLDRCRQALASVGPTAVLCCMWGWTFSVLKKGQIPYYFGAFSNNNNMIMSVYKVPLSVNKVQSDQQSKKERTKCGS